MPPKRLPHGVYLRRRITALALVAALGLVVGVLAVGGGGANEASVPKPRAVAPLLPAPKQGARTQTTKATTTPQDREPTQGIDDPGHVPQAEGGSGQAGGGQPAPSSPGGAPGAGSPTGGGTGGGSGGVSP